MKTKTTKTQIALLTLALLLAFSQQLLSQDSSVNSGEPSWVLMMNDPNTNYHDAIKAFETFWSDKVKPVQEREVFANYKKDKTSSIRKTTGAAALYRFEYKKFQKWKRKVAPYVQEDGSILTPDERLDIWRSKHNKN